MAQKSSAPPGYDIAANELQQKMATLYGYYREVGRGLYHTLLVVGPPGVGKTRGADEYLTASGARVVRVRCNARNLVDVLYRYRHQHIVMLWDDTDFVWTSEPTMNTLKIVADAKGRREIADDRKGGHGRFLVNARFVFITNKPISNPALPGFDAKARFHIEALKSRFQLQSLLTFNDLDCYHFACWLATDGKHLLRDAVKHQGRTLSMDACNEVLAWFSENFNRLTEVSPRILIDQIADYRLKSPDVWRSHAEAWCAPEPRQEIVGFDKKTKTDISVDVKNPPAWQIHAPTKTQVVVEKVDEPETPPAEMVTEQVNEPLPPQMMQITIRRSGQGAHPVKATVEDAAFQTAIADAKSAANNRLLLQRALKLMDSEPVERESAAIVIAAYHGADRLSEGDMQKHGMASIAVDLLPPSPDTPSRREAKKLLKRLRDRQANTNATAQ